MVAAFEKVFGKTKITVPPDHDVTGAIGAAMLARDENTSGKTAFKGFDLSRRNYELASFECRKCPNRCEIKRLKVKGERPLLYGSRCERFEVNRGGRKGGDLPDLFAEREQFLEQACRTPEPCAPDAPVIGIPRCMFYHELLPFFYTFLTGLGYRVVLSEKTHKQIIHRGVESVVAETCFPIKVAHGHVLNLVGQGVRRIFLPSIIEMERIHPEVDRSLVCPYVQALPYTLRSAFNFEELGVHMISPILYFGDGEKAVEKGMRAVAGQLGKAEATSTGLWRRPSKRSAFSMNPYRSGAGRFWISSATAKLPW